MTVSMGEGRRRSKTVVRDGKSKATPVVLAIGQRVQDAASYYAINASVLKKQQDYQSQLRSAAQSDRAESAAAAAAAVAAQSAEGWNDGAGEGVEGLDPTDSTGSRSALFEYNSKFQKVRICKPAILARRDRSLHHKAKCTF